eukprot:CAMPEP_0117539470 /NCGR_PEP_ID=MMETSP0784-20121206/43001_1 /TAXON_ID=39447 /ORGANISM="" /LENGTH=521 /DNA_ID=CAMNT_0005336097 /DNA_START=205 /DNA_END=1770 /DNA_ORIENTATION=-
MTAHWASTVAKSDFKFNANGKCASNENCGEVTGYGNALQQMFDWNEASNGSWAYCGNADYNFQYSDEWIYGPYTCAWLSSSELWSKTSDALFYNTAMETTLTRSFVAPSDVTDASGCTAAFAAANVPCFGGASYALRRCTCASTAFDFFAGVEYMAIGFEHSFDSVLSREIDTAKGHKPRTVIRNNSCDSPECDIYDFPAGRDIKFSVAELLQKLHIDVDGSTCNQNGGSENNAVNNVCPKIRVTGMTIFFYISYYNEGQADVKDSIGDEPIAVIRLDPRITWTGLGNDIHVNSEPTWANPPVLVDAKETINRYRYGIKIVFEGSQGKISKFDVFLLLNTLLQGAVMVQIARMITTVVAKHALGLQSKTYKAVIDEQLSFPKEFARFACQTLIAHETFKAIDSDAGRSISMFELEAMLREALQEELNETEVHACTKALFEVADTRGVGRGLFKKSAKRAWAAEKERGIDLVEFIGMLTDDRFSFDTLKFAIQSKFAADRGATRMRRALSVSTDESSRKEDV